MHYVVYNMCRVNLAHKTTSIADCRLDERISIEAAEWDEDRKTITFVDLDDDRRFETVETIDQLRTYLQEIARSAFCETAPREDGEYVFECDTDGIVDNILMDYEEQLSDFFEDYDEE